MNKFSDKNNKTTQSLRLYLFIAAPLLVWLILFFVQNKKPLYFVGPDSTKVKDILRLTAYNDAGTNGVSEIQLTETDPVVTYRYKLKPSSTFPYIGISFSKKDSSFFDLSGYDYFKIKIKSTNGTRVPLTVTSYIPDYSHSGNHLSYRNSQYVLTINKEYSEILVPFKNMETPDWWYANNNKTEKDFDAPDFSKTYTVQFGNCINIKQEKEDTITIEEISLHPDLRPFYILSVVFLLLYFGSGALLLYARRRVRKTEVNFQYEKIDAINHLEKEEKAVFGFITSEYSDPELTIIDVQNAVGLHERKISAIIKNKTNLNFKQFLNKLRIAEAKRLLSSTDLQVSEIAFKVGYGNASHFNRVFKTSENCSPNDYRKAEL